MPEGRTVVVAVTVPVPSYGPFASLSTNSPRNCRQPSLPPFTRPLKASGWGPSVGASIVDAGNSHRRGCIQMPAPLCGEDPLFEFDEFPEHRSPFEPRHPGYVNLADVGVWNFQAGWSGLSAAKCTFVRVEGTFHCNALKTYRCLKLFLVTKLLFTKLKFFFCLLIICVWDIIFFSYFVEIFHHLILWSGNGELIYLGCICHNYLIVKEENLLKVR